MQDFICKALEVMLRLSLNHNITTVHVRADEFFHILFPGGCSEDNYHSRTHCLLTQMAVWSIDQVYTLSNNNSAEISTNTVPGAVQCNILRCIQQKREGQQSPSIHQTERMKEHVCICVSLPCVHPCSALWAWGKGQRSCGWSRCWLATASSPPSTGSRPSWPAPRTMALQHKRQRGWSKGRACAPAR